MELNLQVDSAPGKKFSMTPYFSIIIGVTLSVLLCILLSFLKRGLRNRRLRCAPCQPALLPSLASALLRMLQRVSDREKHSGRRQHLHMRSTQCCCSPHVCTDTWCAGRGRHDRAIMVQMGPRPRRDRGVDAALVESFPTHEYKASAAVALLPRAGVPVQVALRCGARSCGICTGRSWAPLLRRPPALGKASSATDRRCQACLSASCQ